RSILGITGLSLSSLYNGRKVFVRSDMTHPGPCYKAGSENPVLVRILRLLNAVSRHQDCTGKFVKFVPLILPGASIITDKVGIFLKTRIGQTGQHFSMSIYVYTFPLGLL